MLLNLTSLFGVSILAKDGNIGHVRDVLFDDKSWVIRYFVVETGNQFSGRRVLLSPHSFLQPEWEKRVLPVDLTIEEVRQSPDVDTDLPVYRQQEIAMTLHYGWPAYWTMEASRMTGEESESNGDPNLRSANEILTYKVKTSDGDLGSMDDLVVEDANWFIRFLILSAGNWFEGQKLLVASRWVGSVSWANKEVIVPHSRDII
jgi:sporulation protein YlmC with PRC-barrel domain